MPGYVTIDMFVEIEPNAFIIRHTHPGIESSYRLEGGLDLPIQGQPTRSLKAGDGFQVPPETPHAGVKNGDKKTRLAITYVVERASRWLRQIQVDGSRRKGFGAETVSKSVPALRCLA